MPLSAHLAKGLTVGARQLGQAAKVVTEAAGTKGSRLNRLDQTVTRVAEQVSPKIAAFRQHLKTVANPLAPVQRDMLTMQTRRVATDLGYLKK